MSKGSMRSQALLVLRLSCFAILDLGVFVNAYDPVDAARSTSCEGRCALFIVKKLNPRCQCDGLCLQHRDCCADYKKLCQSKLEPEKKSELAAWVGSIVGVIFSVVLILSIVYFLAVRRKQIRRQSLIEQEEAHIISKALADTQFNMAPPEPEEESLPSPRPEKNFSSSVDATAAAADGKESKAAPTAGAVVEGDQTQQTSPGTTPEIQL